MKSDRPSHLRLVHDQPNHSPRNEQLNLFGQHDRVIFLASVDCSTEADFLKLLRQTAPQAIVDMRVVPRFDFGRLTRRTFFDFVERMPARYHDLAYEVQATNSRDASLNPAIVAESLANLLGKTPRPRVVLVLFDDPVRLEIAVRVLPERLPLVEDGAWTVRSFSTAL